MSDTAQGWQDGNELTERIAALESEIAHLAARNDELEAVLNTPELNDFGKAVPLEAAHQRERWGADHDAAKEPQDWFWTLGYLGGKALQAHASGNTEKAKHHTITAAALLGNWHARIIGDAAMKPTPETK